MERKYSIDKMTSLRWYNLVGIDDKSIDLEGIETEVHDIEDLSIVNKFALPDSSMLIDFEIQDFIRNICENFSETEEGKIKKAKYYNSAMNIIKSCTSINLISEKDTNYILYFERLNYVLLLAFNFINSMNIKEVNDFSDMIDNNDKKGILEFDDSHKAATSLALLSLCGDDNTKDYEIFKYHSTDIDFKKLGELLQNNIKKDSNFEPSRVRINRLSYKKCIELTREL